MNAQAPATIATPEAVSLPADLIAQGRDAVSGFESTHTQGKAAEGKLTDWVKNVAIECGKPDVTARQIGAFVALLRTEQVKACGTMGEDEFQAVQSVHRASVGYVKRVLAGHIGWTFDLNKPKRGKVVDGIDCYRVESVYEKTKGATNRVTDKKPEGDASADQEAASDVTISVDPKDTAKLMRLAITGSNIGTATFELFKAIGIPEAIAVELTLDMAELKATLIEGGKARIASKARAPAKKSGTTGK